jgi:hypothetical protein
MKARLAVAAFPRAFPVATADRSVTSHNDPLISAPEGLAPDGVGKLALGASMPTRGRGTAIGLISPLAVDIAGASVVSIRVNFCTELDENSVKAGCAGLMSGGAPYARYITRLTW